MKENDQITRALQHITTSGGDLDLETDLALKALAADYAARGERLAEWEVVDKSAARHIDRLNAEIERLKALYDDCCRCNGDLMKTAVSKGIEIDDLKAEHVHHLKLAERQMDNLTAELKQLREEHVERIKIQGEQREEIHVLKREKDELAQMVACFHVERDAMSQQEAHDLVQYRLQVRLQLLAEEARTGGD